MATQSLGRDDARPSCTTLHPFTPGPWHVGSHRYIGSPAGTICETLSHMGIEEADANERLIAAAPDLYEALADLLDQVQHAPGGNLLLTGLAVKALKLAQEGRNHG